MFPFKIKHSSVDKVSHDLDHVSFFNEIVHKGPDTSYDDTNTKVRDQNDGSNGFASENEMAVTFDHETTLSEDGDSDIPTTKHTQNINDQPLRRSKRTSVFPNKYNEYVVDSKVKYRLEKYVGYLNLTSEIFCFTTELNKAFEPKTYWQACKEQHSIDAMNKEMKALYDNDT
ncbi:hypothetical protein Tco_1055120 [Tanacetum coccineum]|uniref:Uncharacterized protein n=1 Tax=Tanacetum coccineum TaxID=301880 RepID=A0ABQ5GYP8_9ASTR